MVKVKSVAEINKQAGTGEKTEILEGKQAISAPAPAPIPKKAPKKKTKKPQSTLFDAIDLDHIGMMAEYFLQGYNKLNRKNKQPKAIREKKKTETILKKLEGK